MQFHALKTKAPSKRKKDDFYATPPEVTRALLSNERFNGPIWEPACGDGAMSEVISKEYGYEVFSSDLVHRGYHDQKTTADFLTHPVQLLPIVVGSIITNPPFKLANKFVLKAIDVAIYKVAMLFRLLYLEGMWRKENIFDKYPPSTVYVLSDRPKFKDLACFY